VRRRLIRHGDVIRIGAGVDEAGVSRRPSANNLPRRPLGRISCGEVIGEADHSGVTTTAGVNPMLFKSIREHAGSTGNLAGLNPGWRRVAQTLRAGVRRREDYRFAGVR
jgi:hypothetical protein